MISPGGQRVDQRRRPRGSLRPPGTSIATPETARRSRTSFSPSLLESAKMGKMVVEGREKKKIVEFLLFDPEKSDR